MNPIYFLMPIIPILCDVYQWKVRSKPVFLVSNEKQPDQTAEVKSPLSPPPASSSSSTAEQTQFKSSIPENYDDTRVRRAFLWIKVDAIKSKKQFRENVVMAKNSTRRLRKPSVSHQRQRTFRNFFRLWVFQVVESSVSSWIMVKMYKKMQSIQ